MSRIAVCLFFIAILNNGILKCSQANETSTDALNKNDEETKAAEIEGVTKSEEVPPQRSEPNVDPQNKSEKSEEGKDTKVNDLKKAVTDMTKSTDILKGNPAGKVMSDFPQNILGPVNSGDPRPNLWIPVRVNNGYNYRVETTEGLSFNGDIVFTAVRVKIGDAVTKGMDTAKGLADGTYNFLRSSVGGLF